MKVKKFTVKNSEKERGAAMAIAIITVAILAVVALTALAFSSTEARIAGSDLQRTQTFYAASAGMEKMTNDFSALFQKKLNPTTSDLYTIAGTPPAPLATEGFSFIQTLVEDTARLTELRQTQNLPNTVYPRVNIPDGPYAGLYASIIPYKMSSQATLDRSGTQVKLEREYNNYLVPLFQFGMFSNEDIEVHPGPWMTFNGRVHTNGNLYALRNVKFLNRVTAAGELVRDATRGGEKNDASGWNNVWFESGGKTVQSVKGSVIAGSGTVGGPNLTDVAGKRGYYPDEPEGVANPTWETTSVKSADGTPDQFGGQVMTKTTGTNELKLPLELGGYSAAEIIKRALASDEDIIKMSRYHNKAQVRILLDDETAGSGTSNVAGIPAGKGVLLSQFVPTALNGGNVLQTFSDSGAVLGTPVKQKNPAGAVSAATTVRAVKSATTASAVPYVPPGSGIRGRIYIEIVKPDGTTVDVTQQILSMGVTEGEPNGIVYLQRPLWMSFVQGSRDRSGNGLDLVSLTNNSSVAADGEAVADIIPILTTSSRRFLTGAAAAIDDDGGFNPTREAVPSPAASPKPYNAIVPINVYNVREGWVRSTMTETNVYYDRGVTSVVELNMKNIARWLDGVYDSNLLAGTPAVSANVKGDEGYVVYVSDRRGDQKNAEYLKTGASYASTNGTVDNEDIYGPNGKLDAGEDAIDFGWDANQSGKSKKGTLQKDTRELPDVGRCWAATGTSSSCSLPPTAPVADQRISAGLETMKYDTLYFRRAVRLFNGEKLSITGASGKLSPTKGISVATENMVYIWGNYNTTGITGIPAGGSTLNDGGYTGDQVPASIISDAFFPLSKTWFDALSAMYPEGSATPRTLNGDDYRMADDDLPSDSNGTSVRAGIIAGTTISSLTATPGRDADGLRRNGGIINYPRFLETWNLNGTTHSWNYTGSFIPLYRSTQALSQWENDTSIIYMPPRRNWSFDSTFLSPQKLPPGTPFFQYVQATGFRQTIK